MLRLIGVLFEVLMWERESDESSVAGMKMVEEGQNKPKIASKRMKLLHEPGGDGVKDDRISALPDHLILEILSRLPSTNDAIKTGTLSKRWKHLWTCVPTLIFDDRVVNLPLSSDFVSMVDKTLTQCSQSKLKKFEVYTGYDIRFGSQVNNWIRYALSCNVEELKLGLRNTIYEAGLVLDELFFTGSCFTHLTLAGCLFIPIGAISWKNLRSLSISYGILDEDLIKNILSGSPLLETLVLDYCKGYRRVNITSKSIKKLVFSGYIFLDDVSDDAGVVEINAPHISSLTIKCCLCLWKILLLDVSSLVEANLNYTLFHRSEATLNEVEEEMLKGTILNLCNVKELKIGVTCSEALSRLQAKGFIIPSKVKCRSVTRLD